MQSQPLVFVVFPHPFFMFSENPFFVLAFCPLINVILNLPFYDNYDIITLSRLSDKYSSTDSGLAISAPINTGNNSRDGVNKCS